MSSFISNKFEIESSNFHLTNILAGALILRPDILETLCSQLIYDVIFIRCVDTHLNLHVGSNKCEQPSSGNEQTSEELRVGLLVKKTDLFVIFNFELAIPAGSAARYNKHINTLAFETHNRFSSRRRRKTRNFLCLIHLETSTNLLRKVLCKSFGCSESSHCAIPSLVEGEEEE